MRRDAVAANEGIPTAAVLLLQITFLAVTGCVHRTSAPPTVPAPSAIDPIIGAWELNSDKSTNPPAASELITIVSQGSGFKLTFDIKQDNEYNPHYDIVTDMNGATVKPTNADGKQTSDEWRVTRLRPNAFEMELQGPFGGWKDDYEVSPDGKTLTLRRVLNEGRVHVTYRNGQSHEVILIFEKVQ
jgi:hypothetical protein